MVRMTRIMTLQTHRMRFPPPWLDHHRRAKEECASVTWCNPWKPLAGIRNTCPSITSVLPVVMHMLHAPRFPIHFVYVWQQFCVSARNAFNIFLRSFLFSLVQNFSRQSILYAKESQYHASILVLLLENWKVFVVDRCIQYWCCTGDLDGNHLTFPRRGWNFPLALTEMMTHIPVCSVVPEPSNVLILNTCTQTAAMAERNDTRLLGYAILQQLLQCYQSILYRVVFVEEDPLILQVWKEFWDEELFRDACIEVVHANPLTYLQDSVPGRYQVIFVTHDFSEEDASDETRTDPWAMVHQSLVPGGVACTLISNPSLHYLKDATDPPCTIEYARLPYLHPTSLLRVHIRESTSSQPTCRFPVRQPILSRDAQLQEYSNATHRAAFILPPCLQRYQSECNSSNDLRISLVDEDNAASNSTDNNQYGEDAEGTGSREQLFGCLEHDKIASLFQALRISTTDNAIVSTDSSVQDRNRGNGSYEKDRRCTVRETHECFSIVQKPSCTIQ
jgi:hypothetical protein